MAALAGIDPNASAQMQAVQQAAANLAAAMRSMGSPPPSASGPHLNHPGSPPLPSDAVAQVSLAGQAVR